jgi:hypothetical protein
VLAKTRQWGVLLSAGVVGEFGHTDVQPVATAPPPTEEQLMELFKDCPKKRMLDELENVPESELKRRKARNEMMASIEKLSTDKKWVGATPSTEQDQIAGLALLRTLDEGNLYADVGTSWMTAFLPKGQLIKQIKAAGDLKIEHENFWVLKTNEFAALCWPAEEVADGIWEKKRGIKSLFYYSLFDFDHVRFLETKRKSPLNLCIEDFANVSLQFNIYIYIYYLFFLCEKIFDAAGIEGQGADR